MFKVSRALLSVSDKTGIVEFARFLADSGVTLLSTGGTAATLRAAAIPVTDVSQITGFPEIMNGRVKTLHPRIHGGLLARLDQAEDVDALKAHGIEPIDLLVVNLYPFEQTVARDGVTLEEAIENIDIGGPAMIRAGAKNYRFTAVVTRPDDYPAVVDELSGAGMSLTESTRARLMRAAFAHTAHYDAAIARYFETNAQNGAGSARTLKLDAPLDLTMRYGENPHQQATLYGRFSRIFQHLHGKELSYNNILDIDAAARLILEFDEPTVAIIKHTNPCGVGTAPTLLEAWRKAFATDTKSAFGGIIAVNRPLDLEAADAINQIFTEVIIAPDYDAGVLDLLRKKKDRRLILASYDALRGALGDPQVRSVAGGMLMQDYDAPLMSPEGFRIVTKRTPDSRETAALQFAWKVAKHVKSNAIVYAAPDRTLGIGAGQMSRVDSAMIAARKASAAGLDLDGCAVASDAFFPFADGLMEAVEAGATAVIQPGGSVRDQEVIEAADQNGIAMALTGMRHFRH